MNSAQQLHLNVEDLEMSDGLRREVLLSSDRESQRNTIFYEIFDAAAAALPVLDGPVLAVLFHCMQQGLPLRIHGTLSESGIRNLHEVQRAWVLWKPEKYRQIDLIPDAVVAAMPSSKRTMQAFSAGVDATFTLVSNMCAEKNRGGYAISAGLLVHGFDVPYRDTDGFARLVDRARQTLDHAGVELKLLRTNSRALNLQSWMDSNTAQLAACLHQFSAHFGRALIGSAEPYDVPSLGIGANPITDPLFSGDLMAIVHDGAGYSRTEKVEMISSFPFFADRLKVCWQGGSAYENCGECEKCLRTRLNFAAVGQNSPGCFSGTFHQGLLRKLRPGEPIEIAELQQIITFVRRRSLSFPWVNALRRRILLSRLTIPLKRLIRWPQLKAFARSVLSALRFSKHPEIGM